MPSQPAQLKRALSNASLSELERRALEHFVARLEKDLGDDLRAIWLYGSRARGEPPHPESDVDLMVIVARDERRYSGMVSDLRYDVIGAAGAKPAYFSVFTHDVDWLRGRREIRSFFIQEVDRNKVILAGSAL